MEHNEVCMRNYSDIINANPVLSKDDEAALIKIVKGFKDSKQKQEARDRLIKSNLRMVLKEASYYSKHSGVSTEDLIGAGVQGLCEAIDRFKSTKKTKLSTYAIPWIKVKIIRLVTDHSSNIYVPRHIIEQSRKYRNAHNDTEQKSSLTDKDLMKELNVTERGLQNIRLAQGQVVSMNEARYTDDSGNETTTQDLIADPRAIGADQILEEKEIKDKVREEIAKLDPISISILSRRYLCDHKEDLHEIGKDLNITGERVRQIESKALRLMRRRMKNRFHFGA